MSRPPAPHPPASTGGDRPGDLARPDELPPEYAQLLAIEHELAVAKLGRPLPDEPPDLGDADTTRTFMELSALVAHVLAVHQRRYAGEAFIGTAVAPSNMLRHARRLGHQPDTGLAASGYVVLFAKEGAGGTVAAGLPLATVALGDQAAEDYETLDDLPVDATLNDIGVMGATRPVRLDVGADRFRLRGVGHRIRPGDAVALIGPHWQGFVVTAVSERPAEDATVVAVASGLTGTVVPGATDPAAPAVLLAHPTRTLRPFGAHADPAAFPPKEVRNAGGPPLGEVAGPAAGEVAAAPTFWYEVQRSDGGAYVENDVYLSGLEAEPLREAYLLRRDGTRTAVRRVAGEAVAAVTLHRQAQETFTTHKVTITPKGSGFESSLTEVAQTQTVTTHVSGTVTAVQVATRQGTVEARRDHPFPADWLTGWSTEAPLAEREPNALALPEPLILVGELAGLTPGRPLAFVSRSGTAAEIVTVRRAAVGPVPNQTHVWWDATGVGGPPPGGWTLDDLRVHGNVARVSHGRTVTQTLGGSDGVTPFQRFALDESPVTVLTGATGGEAQIEVRVGGVAWTMVPDLAGSGPDDQHHRIETDDRGVTTVVFGDGRNGAVPPSGRGNLTVTYRVGLGPAGDAGTGRLRRITRAHPLLDRAVNVTPVHGGTAPAGIDAVRDQAPRFIRAFDRAVSVGDLADLALTIPGIARAAARWDQAEGAVLVVATAAGETPPALAAVRAFLDARRDVTVPLRLVGPRPHDLRLTLEVEADPAYLAEVVKSSIRAALHGDTPAGPGMFTFPARDLGQPAYLSQLYQRLEGEPGVVGVRVVAFSSHTASGVADVVPAAADEWLRLRSNDLSLAVVGSPA